MTCTPYYCLHKVTGRFITTSINHYLCGLEVTLSIIMMCYDRALMSVKREQDACNKDTRCCGS